MKIVIVEPDNDVRKLIELIVVEKGNYKNASLYSDLDVMKFWVGDLSKDIIFIICMSFIISDINDLLICCNSESEIVYKPFTHEELLTVIKKYYKE